LDRKRNKAVAVKNMKASSQSSSAINSLRSDTVHKAVDRECWQREKSYREQAPSVGGMFSMPGCNERGAHEMVCGQES
jgi:hypothetical protein